MAHRYKVVGDGTQERARPVQLFVYTVSAFVTQASFPIHRSQYLLAV